MDGRTNLDQSMHHCTLLLLSMEEARYSMFLLHVLQVKHVHFWQLRLNQAVLHVEVAIRAAAGVGQDITQAS